jgi:phage major head subunit gpT-like protein
MSAPATKGQWFDLIDKSVTKYFEDAYTPLPDRLSEVFDMQSSGDAFEKWSAGGALPNFTQFTGTVNYQSMSQGYDVTATHVPFANGIQIERELYDDDRHGQWAGRPKALARAYHQTRQGHGARIFNTAFSVDSFFYSNSEGVSLCSDSHTTNSGVSTATGFDNLITSSLSATAVEAAYIQMRDFRNDVGQKISVMPSKLVVPVSLYPQAMEIVKSLGKVDTANNNVNFSNGMYELFDWEYLTDTNNWFMIDGRTQKDNFIWFDRVPIEFAMAEELDTLVAKWRAYARYSFFWRDWRSVIGANVS